ncbi:hypothetical protein [Nocardia aurantiaca]|uniref:Uncharacterized protein n=1 Tax=Nocardia aurantiaca TaxID=2675850 RepID=A0A6I3L3U9_9NOCA|nr:hypothetical protein [Nocardia aurantiaca]MTE15176.1 hypothetical protein [Nocardia aurantiaca]
MTYPPAGPGGDPNAHGQPPQDPDPAWWDHPAQQAGGEHQPQQPGWPGQQPAGQAGWEPTQVNWTAQQGYPQQQGHPQDTGYAQQPGFQQNPGFSQQAGFPQHPGFPQQPGFPPPQQPKTNTGLIVGVVLGVVVLLAVAVGAIVLVSGEGDSSQADATTTTTAPTTTSASTTTRGAPTTSKSAPGGSRFSYTEFGKDWNFKLGDVALQAAYVSGRDFDSCAPIEEAGKLTGLGCQRASEMAWKAENGALMLTQLVLTMSDADKASGADGQFDDKDVILPEGSYINDFETGKWRDGSQGKFLVITVATATPAVDDATISKYLKYRNSDTLGALAFR